MIDITQYQQKLEWLRQYMAQKIDGTLFNTIMCVNIEVKNNYSPEQIMRIYEQTGLMFYTTYPDITSTLRPPTFEEYCKDKQINK